MAKRKKVPNPVKVQEAEKVELTIEQKVEAQAELLSTVMARVNELHKWAQSVDQVVARNIPYIDAAALFAFKALDDDGKIELPEEWTPNFARAAQEKIGKVVQLLQASVATEGEGEAAEEGVTQDGGTDEQKV